MASRELVRKYRDFLLKKENVKGVSRGLKVDEDGNIISDEEVIVVTVKEKKSESELKSSDIVPKTVDGSRTIVRDFGEIKTHGENKKAVDPLEGGVSFGYKDISTGTLGCVLKTENMFYLLSNNHVIADSNRAKIGGDLLQPAHTDCEANNCKCGELDRYVRINFNNNSLFGSSGVFSRISDFFKDLFGSKNSKVIRHKGDRNVVDCALGRLIGKSVRFNNILELGEVQGVRDPELGMEVKKVGRTSGLTEGKITQLDATLEVNFGLGRAAEFEDQIVTTPISEPGDSGSLVLDKDNYIIGLLFAGSDKVSILNPIKPVFDSLNIEPKFST